MEKVVVDSSDIAGELENGVEITYGELFDQDKLSGKLTMQDVEAMASEFGLQKACGGSDKGCMIAALNTVGIEVE